MAASASGSGVFVALSRVAHVLPSRSTRRTLGGVPDAASRRAISPVVVGRDAELAILGRAIAEMGSGPPRVVIIGGEAGIGKTRLLDEAIARTHGAIRVVRGHGLAFGSDIPYLPFAEMLRGLVREEPAEAADLLGPARPELARLMPELSTERVDRRALLARPVGDGRFERLRLFEALLRTAERIALATPTLFAIDDLQWVDAASLELLAFLAHNVRAGSALLVLTVRSEALEAAGPALRLVSDLERQDTVDRIELGPLGSEATRRQVGAIVGDRGSATLAMRIQALSDGNPFFTEELLFAMRTGGATEVAISPRLRDLLGVRLARLSGDCLAVIRVAAAAGRSVDTPLLVRVSSMRRVDVERAIRDAVDEQILVRSLDDAAPGYRFRHEITRTMVESRLLPDEAARLHGRYAHALGAETDSRPDPAVMAYHWDAAGDARRALTAHVEAGLAAEAGYAFAEALVHLERAIALWTAVDDPEAQVGLPRDVVASTPLALRRGLATTSAPSSSRGRCIASGPQAHSDSYEVARSSLRWYLWESGQQEAALAEAREAVASSGGPGRWRANALAHLAGLELRERRIKPAMAHATDALSLARGAGAIEEEILAGGVLGWCLVHEGRLDDGIDGIRGALMAAYELQEDRREPPTSEQADRARFPIGIVIAHVQLAAALELVGRLEEAHEIAVAGATASVDQGVERTYGSALRSSAGRALYLLGRWDEAEATLEAALERGAIGSGRAGSWPCWRRSQWRADGVTVSSRRWPRPTTSSKGSRPRTRPDAGSSQRRSSPCSGATDRSRRSVSWRPRPTRAATGAAPSSTRGRCRTRASPA